MLAKDRRTNLRLYYVIVLYTLADIVTADNPNNRVEHDPALPTNDGASTLRFRVVNCQPLLKVLRTDTYVGKS